MVDSLIQEWWVWKKDVVAVAAVFVVAAAVLVPLGNVEWYVAEIDYDWP